MATNEGQAKKATILDCPICLEDMKSPRYLPCKHTYCEICLKTYIEGTAKTVKGVWSFCCPVCRTSFPAPKPSTSIEQWVSTFPLNQILLALMKNTHSKSKVTYSCDPCDRVGDDARASHWCSDCSELLCDVCLENFHKRMKDADRHVVIDISETLSLPGFNDKNVQSAVLEPCELHEGKFYEAFCLNHSELCCVFCLVHNHRNCADIKTLDELKIELPTGTQVKEAGSYLRCISELLLKIIGKRSRQITGLEKEASRIVLEAERDIDRCIAKLKDMKSEIKVSVFAECDSETTPRKQEITFLRALHERVAKETNSLETAEQQTNTLHKLFALLKTQKSFKHYYQEALNDLAAEQNRTGINFKVSFISWLSQFMGEKKQLCFEVRKMPSENILCREDLSKTEIERQVSELNDFFLSMIRRGAANMRDENVSSNDSDTLDKDSDGELLGHGIYVTLQPTTQKQNKKRHKKRK